MNKSLIYKWLIILAATTAPALANAAIVTDYLGVNSTTSVGTGVSGTPILGNTLVDTGYISTSNTTSNGDYVASGRAQSGLDTGLKAMAYSEAPTIVTGPSVSTISTSIFQSSWRDVLMVSGSGIAPSELLFTFHVDALLTSYYASNSGTYLFDDFSTGGVNVTASQDLSLFPAPSSTVGASAFVQSIEGSVPSAGVSENGLTWDSTSFVQSDIFNYNFDGTFSLLSSFVTDPALPDGGYFMSVGLNAYSESRGGAAVSDAFGTLTLTSITMADGSPLPADLLLAFESGASISSVPIPASLWLFVSGIGALIGLARRRAS